MNRIKEFRIRTKLYLEAFSCIELYFNYRNFVGQSKIVTKFTSKNRVLDTKENKTEFNSNYQFIKIIKLLTKVD